MKRFSLGLAVLLMAIGFAAFTTPQKAKHKRTGYDYLYTESSNTNSTDPSKYILSESAEGCDHVSDVICMINAPFPPDEDDHPTFTQGTDPLDNSVGISVTFWKP